MSQTSPSTVLVKKVPTLGQNEENIVYVCHCTIARKKRIHSQQWRCMV